jgi:hypothetical protein
MTLDDPERVPAHYVPACAGVIAGRETNGEGRSGEDAPDELSAG